jgi:hypothetical protein
MNLLNVQAFNEYQQGSLEGRQVKIVVQVDDEIREKDLLGHAV